MLPIHHMIAEGPRPVAPFSHAVEADGWVFVTGQMPTDPNSPEAPLPHGIEAQTRRVMDNLMIVLAGVGLTLDNVTMARVYLTDFHIDYALMNEVYLTKLLSAGSPAGANLCCVYGIAVHALVEIDLIARRP